MDKIKKIYFIGIGGISMSSLADISRQRGYVVAGSDKTATAMTECLERNGIKIFYSHNAENVEGFDLVVYSGAISQDNPELVRAKELNIPCIKRSAYLGKLMLDYKTRIGVAGMHGKTTVTSMISNIYLQSELDPTIVNGAEMTEINGAYRLGNHENFIFEACEYTDSFLDFYQTTAVILNVEMDHPDYFKDLQQIKESFRRYIDIADVAVVNNDDNNIREIIKDYNGKTVSYGIKISSNYMAVNINFIRACAEFDIQHNGNFLCKIKLSVPGQHNIYNALASIATAHHNGVDISGIIKGINNFKGAKRRFEYKGIYNGALIYEDYAHHPSEVKTTLSAVKDMGYNKIWCVYQPHTYSRTAELYNDFLTVFDELSDRDTVILIDIYAAREENISGVTSKKLTESIGKSNVIYIDNFDKTAQYIKENVSDGDIVLLMGAGDVNKIGDLIL